ncbi:MAG: PQQ-binding-like beta-propeller repeat protein [Candidatus Zixiibacteriota bacterium]
MTGYKNSILVLVLLFGLAGCSSQYRLNRDVLEIPSAWPFYHGGPAATGAVNGGNFNGQLSVLWENSVSGKPAGPMTIYHDVLVFPETKKKIRYFDMFTGQYLGLTKTRGIPQTGLVIKDSLAYYSLAPRKNYLQCVNLFNNDQVWKHPVKDAASGSILLENSVIVGSGDGFLVARNADDGHLIWQAEIEGKLIAPASFRDGKVFQPADKGVIYVFSADDGAELYRVEMAGPIIASVVVDRLAYAADIFGNLLAFNPADGGIVWRVALAEPVRATPALSRDRLYVGLGGGQIVALQAADGAEIWRFDTREVINAAPVVVDRFIVLATMSGRLYVLKSSDGALVDKLDLGGPIACGPVSDGQRVVAATQRGRIICFGESNEHPTQAGQ